MPAATHSPTSSVHSRPTQTSSPEPSHLPSVLAPGPASVQRPFNHYPTSPPYPQQPHYQSYAASYPSPSHPTPSSHATSHTLAANQWSSLPPQHAQQSHSLPRALGTDPYAYLYTSNVPDVPGANGTSAVGRHPVVGRRQRVSVACTYCRRRKIRCDGGDVCSNCSRASRHCEYTAVTEESTRRERDFPQRRRGNASTETGVPIPSAYASNILGSPMSDWSPPSEYLNLPISGTSVGGSGFDGPVPTWSNGNSPAIGYQRSVELNSPAIPQSPSINQRGFQQTSYPTSSLSGYGGQPSSWQPTHATSSSSSSNRSIGRHFPNVSIGTPRHETQCGVIGSTDTFYMGHTNSSSSNEDYYRPQLSRMSTFPVLNTPRHTPNSRSTSPHSKAKATSYSSFSALVSPPQTPIFEVQPFNYAINPSELQTFKGMSGLNIRVPVPLTTSMVNDDGMRHLFAGVPGLESAAPVVDQTRPPPPPYSIMA